MSDSDGLPDFYAEIHTPAAIRDSYAPEGRCLGCDAKLSIYRTMSGGEYDKWCAPCQEKAIFPLQCTGCWETFPSFGTRTICNQCLVPAQREKRHDEAFEKASRAVDLIYRYGFSYDKTVAVLKYSSTLELKRAFLFLQAEPDDDE